MGVSRDNWMGASPSWIQMVLLSGSMTCAAGKDPLAHADMRTSMCDWRIATALERFPADQIDRNGFGPGGRI
jgi:hypothetical protein